MRNAYFAATAALSLLICPVAFAENLPPPIADAHAQFAPPAPPQSFGSRFAGAYAAVIGGYDFSTKGSQIGPTTGYASFPAIEGGKIGGAVGYNATSDRLLLGIEGRGQYSFAEHAGGYSFSTGSATLPSMPSSFCSFGCAAGSIQSSFPYRLRSATDYRETLSRPFSLDLSFRAGIIFDEWLIFGRAGAGIEQTKLVSVSDQSGTATCLQPTITNVPATRFGINGFDQVATACGGGIQSGTVTTTLTQSISPIMVVGAGVEKNFGNVFARLEAELTAHFPPNGYQTYYSPAANFAVGYRF